MEDPHIPMPEFYEPAIKGVSTHTLNGKQGFVLPDGTKQDAVYDKILSYHFGFIVTKDGLFGLIDKNAQSLTKVEYEKMLYDGNKKGNSLIVRKNDKEGALNFDGKTILSPKYRSVVFCDANNAHSFVESKDGLLRMILNEKEKELPYKPEHLILYRNLVILKQKGKYGVVSKGKTIVPFEYDSICYALENDSKWSNKKPAPEVKINILSTNFNKQINYLIAIKGGKHGLLDRDGNIIYSLNYDFISYEGHKAIRNIYWIRKDKKVGAFLADYAKKIEVEYESLSPNGEYFRAFKNKQMGLMDRKGDLIIPIEYSDVTYYNDSSFRVTKDQKVGLMDREGNISIPLVYDKIQKIDYFASSSFYIVKYEGKEGIINTKNETIVPFEYEYVGEFESYFIAKLDDNRKGLYDKQGNSVLPLEYMRISKSKSYHSTLIELKRKENSYNFLGKDNKLLFAEDIKSFGFVEDEEKLVHPNYRSRKDLIYIQNAKGKYGILNETDQTVVVPMEYDSIVQKTLVDDITYFSVKKGSKYGLINDKNEIIIPLKYDSISLDFVTEDYHEKDEEFLVVVSTNKKFGVVNNKNTVVIPFVYNDVSRISSNGLYKARAIDKYIIINDKNAVVHKGPFDEVANFEYVNEGFDATESALTFNEGEMRILSDKGTLNATAITMQPHVGYKTFEELKLALINALNSKDEILLHDFVNKIAPSAHILHYLKTNPFSDNPLYEVNIDFIKEAYLRKLINFKYGYWRSEYYDQKDLTEVTDYTSPIDGWVKNYRMEKEKYGDSDFLEHLLRHSYKINGYWISSYFMNRRFDGY